MLLQLSFEVECLILKLKNTSVCTCTYYCLQFSTLGMHPGGQSKDKSWIVPTEGILHLARGYIMYMYNIIESL